MADSYQTRAQLVTALADNTSGAITAQVVRNLLYSGIILNSSGLMDIGAATTPLKLPAAINLDLNGNNLLHGGSMSFDTANLTSDGSGNLTGVSFHGNMVGGTIAGTTGHFSSTLTAVGASNLDNGHATSDGAGNFTFVSVAGENASMTGFTGLNTNSAERRATITSPTGNVDTTLVKLGAVVVTNGVDYDAAEKAASIDMWGQTASATTKRWQFYYGLNGTSADTLILDTGVLSTPGAGTWHAHFDMLRINNTHLAIFVSLKIDAAGLTKQVYQGYATITDAGGGVLTNVTSGSVYVTVGAGAAANDITLLGAYSLFMHGTLSNGTPDVP